MVDAAALSLDRLRWRCRRGMLENDLLIERFFIRHGSAITPAGEKALGRLMELSDNDLLDLLLARTRPSGLLDAPDIHSLLALMRPTPPERGGTAVSPIAQP